MEHSRRDTSVAKTEKAQNRSTVGAIHRYHNIGARIEHIRYDTLLNNSFKEPNFQQIDY